MLIDVTALVIVLCLSLSGHAIFQEQRVFIIEQYFTSLSYACVIDEFRVKYPNIAVPNNSTITRFIARFRETGLVSDNKKNWETYHFD